jgi:hypothetical protein
MRGFRWKGIIRAKKDRCSSKGRTKRVFDNSVKNKIDTLE